MKKYPQYKKSGFDWFGEIPNEWDLVPIWILFKLGRGRVLSNEEISNHLGQYPVYSSQTENNGILGYIDTYDFEGKYITWTTDGANAGTVSYREGKFNCTNVCGTLYPKTNINLKYFTYLLSLVTGAYVRYDINPKLMNGVMGSIHVLVPSLKEQENITLYLDGKVSRIDKLISKKQKLINLLKEERTAIINQAVTEGIDPNVEMKDSGIEWLGKIPAHWDVKRFKYCASIANGQVDPKDPNYLNMPLVAPNHIESGTGKLLSIETVLEQGAESGKYLYAIGNILYSKIRPNLKKACIPQFVGLCSADMYPIRIKRDLRPEFLLNFLLSEAFTKFAIERSMRVAMPKINREDLNNCNLVLPPLSEQDNIIQYIKDELGKLDDAVAKAEREIELIKEYRTTLISEVVTGKIDMRNEVDSWI